MKFLRISLAALAATLSLPAVVFAQSTQTSADAGAPIVDRYLTPVQAELVGRIDSRNAVVGQEVAAKTREKATLADGTTLPKGTRLAGHVAEVQALGKEQPYATLAITFDRAELKGEQSVALRSVIRGVEPPVNLPASGSPMMDAPSGPMGGVGTAASAGRRGGVMAPVRPGGQTAGTSLGGVGADGGALAAAASQAPGGAVAQAGESVSSVPRATGLPGVMLSTSAAASGTLMAAGRNISLESGTQIMMGVIVR